MAKKITLEIGDAEQVLLASAIKGELKQYDTMIAMLLRKEQSEAVRPLMAKVKILQKMAAQVEGNME